MTMFCYQCQETLANTGCHKKAGMCGKTAEVAKLQDLLLFVLKGIAVYVEYGRSAGFRADEKLGQFVMESLFTTITNANFDALRFEALIHEALSIRNEVKKAVEAKVGGPVIADELPEAATWFAESVDAFYEKAVHVGVLSTENEDVRSLRELLIYGLKGMAAYGKHAAVLGKYKQEVIDFFFKALAATTHETLSRDELVALVLECGQNGVEAMALLDAANTEAYGHPEPTRVHIGVGSKPGILISGHDLKDMEELLKQTEGSGVDVYTHSEMLPAHYYPAFKKYEHFVGNYGNAWWKQQSEFESFNGPILFTTNCIVPPRASYKDRMFTTGAAGFAGCAHIPDPVDGGTKDFSAIIDMAKTCQPPQEIESGTIVGGFAHEAVMAVADKVVEAVKSGAISRFVVMAGCDGRQKGRKYFSDVAEQLPQDAVILTAGCAKYRYNKLDLGEVAGLPRVLDAGQCNDSYSLAVIALKLKEVFGLEDINELPISYDIAWYEQKAVIVLLALLSLGVKHIRLGPTLPAFLSPNVARVLVENFDIKPIGSVEDDVAAIMAGN
ncbi:hydroxylamine reductase [candidate division KSB3 bacterium]|uniref:Hydroxylamine reductase n=1 Tax=candidate division KSB3 bacterium TaxID=2044937 RepID=A0A2G6EA40_9BACT|nr:MAG: hydroxylamine reductase [candidate division KSB3 bacterium]PIE30985.1 MAG: hydroxylamine reductase [candidate division KSB3 bacterium]